MKAEKYRIYLGERGSSGGTVTWKKYFRMIANVGHRNLIKKLSRETRKVHRTKHEINLNVTEL